MPRRKPSQPKPKQQPKLDARKLLKPFGTPRQIVERIQTWGVKPPAKNTVEKWAERGVVPMRWFMVLALIARDQGDGIDIYDFIVT